MEDNVSKIKDRLDVVEVLSSYMKIQKAGINYKGRCPFHNEKTPSFFVSPERQIWHCFGCGKGGDMFEFVKEIESVEFPEALRILASRAGIELEQFRPKPGESVDAKQKLFEICELAAKFFEKQFASPTGKEAMVYLAERGLSEETIKEFRLGFAPNDWEALTQFLLGRGYREKEIVDAGLAVGRNQESNGKNQGAYDRFRSRIMFPISDISGRVVGFTARVFQPSGAKSGQPGLAKDGVSMAKYINTPQTLIYDKSRVLYGLSKAKIEIKKSDRCILVEGNMDALMSYQAGVRNVVASSGTALTPTHLGLLQRYTKNLGFCFDTDQAGAAATRRGIGLALAQQFNISILEINDQECKDPADYVKKYGPEWSKVVAGAKPVIDFYFDRARSSYNPTSAGSKSQIIAAVAPFVKRLGTHVERAHWISQLSALLRVPESAVLADIASFKDDLDVYVRTGEAETESKVESLKPKVIETPDAVHEMILSVVLKDPALFQEEINTLPPDLLEPQTMNVLKEIMEEPFDVAQGKPFEFKSFVAKFEGNEALQLEFANLRAQELWQEFTPEDLKAEFQSLVYTLQRRSIGVRLATLQFDVKEAEAAKDRHRLDELAREFNELARQLTLTHYPNGQIQNKETPQIQVSSPDQEIISQKESRPETETDATRENGI